MADVTTYRHALVSYFSPLGAVNVGEIRASTDALVVANPAYWSAFTDAEIQDEGQLTTTPILRI